MPTACRRTHTTELALSFLLCAMVSICASAAETPALKILRDIKSLQGQHPFLAPELLPSLVELGQLYGAGQCDRAIDILDLALEVSRRDEGLFNTSQLDIYAPLMNCYVTLDRPADLERAQQYVILINEKRYGREDLRLLPTLDEAARRYEEVGMYLSARKLHRRAVQIVQRNAGEKDLRLVTPLRGIARAFRLEYAYGLALPDLADMPYEAAEIVSYASFDGMRTRLDYLGGRSLERAVEILRSHADADRNEYVDTLVELGDWHQLGDHRREARRIYGEAWRDLAAREPAPDTEHAELFSRPVALFARTGNSSRLRRPPPDADRYQKYTVDMDYAVTREGRVRDINIIESDASRGLEIKMARDLKMTRFRPRFLDGQPVDTEGVYQRQNFYGPHRQNNTQVAAK